LGLEFGEFRPLRNRHPYLREAGARDTVGGYEPGTDGAGRA
jgi:hypothetical protein